MRHLFTRELTDVSHNITIRETHGIHHGRLLHVKYVIRNYSIKFKTTVA